MTIDIPDSMLYGASQNATVKKPGDFRRRGPDGPPWVVSSDKTRKPKGNKPELLDKARAAGHDLPDKITVPELVDLLGPEPADELYGRPSAFGEMLEGDPYRLLRWKERLLLTGLSITQDDWTGRAILASEADAIIARAYEAAEHDLAARRGSHIHLIVEHVLRGQAWGHLIADGEKLGIPAPLQVRIAEQYVEFRQAIGVRSIAVELAIVNDEWKVAGTLDCLDGALLPIVTPWATVQPGEAIIADVKTGGLKDADDAPSWWVKYGPQVCAYADGVPYDVDREVRLEWPAVPHPDVALIYHYDLARALDGEPVAWQAIPVNLAAARAGGEIVKAAQQWAKRDDLFAPPITIEGALCRPTPTPDPGVCLTSTDDSGPASQSTTSGKTGTSASSTGVADGGGAKAAAEPPTSPSPSTSTAASSASRDALRARIAELVAAGHEPLIRAAWPHGVAPLSKPGHTDDDLALILTAVRRVESDVSWPFRPDDGTVATPSRKGSTWPDTTTTGTAAMTPASSSVTPASTTPALSGTSTSSPTTSSNSEMPSSTETTSDSTTESDPEDTPPASPAVTDESPPRPAPQLPDEGGDVDPATVAALQAAFAALPDAARQAIGVISAEANAAGRSISVTAQPTLRRWCIARALVRWGRWPSGHDEALDCLWSRVGRLLDSSQVTPADTTLGALIGALTREQADLLHDTFDITIAA